MANYEVKFLSGTTARVKTLNRAAKLARGKPFVARKLLRRNRKAAWAKYQLIDGWVECLVRQGEAE